jgi:hypothetical protein
MGLLLLGSSLALVARAMEMPQAVPPVEQPRIAEVVRLCAYLERNDGGEYRELLVRLADRGDFPTLEAISESSLTFRHYACEEIVKALPPRDAVAYCCGLELGSWNWRAAFLALECHPKEVVLPYVLEVVVNPDPIARHACYNLCLNRRWPELAWRAYADLGDHSTVNVPNSDDITVGIMARNYLLILAGRTPSNGMRYLRGLTPAPGEQDPSKPAQAGTAPFRDP